MVWQNGLNVAEKIFLLWEGSASTFNMKTVVGTSGRLQLRGDTEKPSQMSYGFLRPVRTIRRPSKFFAVSSVV